MLQELRTATDLALRATKVTARALGQTMSTLVVQERHLWLTLADMRESDKHRFLDSPISQAGLFGEAMEDFAQQFFAAQKQTEAFRHPAPAVRCCLKAPPPAAAPPPARRRRRPPAASTSAPARPQQQPSQWPQHGAGRREAARPASAPAKPVKCQGRRRPWDGTQNFIRAVSFFSGSQEGEDGSARDPVSTFPSPSLFASGQQGPVRGRDAFSRAPCPAVEPGECCTTHSDPTSRRSAFRVGPLGSTALPHRGYVYVSPGPACTAPGAWLELPRPSRWLLRTIRLGYAIQFARRPSQVQGQSVHQDAPVLRAEVAVLLAKDAIQPAPPAEMESGLYKGPYFIVPKKHGGLHPIWDLRVLNRALVKLPFKMLTQRRLFQCVRPFDWVAAIDLKDAYFHVSILPRFRFAYKGASIPVGPPLRAPQPVGASGQPGKEQTLPYAEDLFSRQGVGLGQPHSTSLRGACSVNAEMPGVSPAQEGGSTETFSEAPGAYGILSRYHAARIASYETASALASRPSPEMGMAPRHIPGLTHPVLPSHLQPVVGSCLSSGRSPLEQVSRHVVVSTDASATGWGAMCNGHAAAGLWTGPQLQWHINCLELLAV